MTQRELGVLKEISPDEIQRNPENPRLFFRPEELTSLLESISEFGIQVPITVYRDQNTYVLIDGERRWRCAQKLNLKRIPALVQPKPTPLENLLLMFNIHALREQWDYLTIANKLPDVIALFVAERNKEPNEIELSRATGLTRGQIRRCRFLLDLPQQYREMLLLELERPKPQQKLSEDFFIEMERALKAVVRRVPEAVPDLNDARDVLIHKFRSDVITNIIDFRKLSKIATSLERFSVPREQVALTVAQILTPSNRVGISEVYSERFEVHYDERKIELNVQSILGYLHSVEEEDDIELNASLRRRMLELRDLLDRILEA